MRNFFQTIKSLITKPTSFFISVTYDRGIKDAFLFVLILDVLLVISTVINPGIWIFLPASAALIIVPFIFLGALAGVVVSLGLLFLAALVLNAFYHLFKGQGTYKDSFNLLAYSLFPFFIAFALASLLVSSTVVFGEYAGIAMVILMFPLIILRFGALVWYGFLATIGGSILHKVSKVDSLLAGVVFPVVLLTAVGISIFILIIAFGFILGATV